MSINRLSHRFMVICATGVAALALTGCAEALPDVSKPSKDNYRKTRKIESLEIVSASSRMECNQEGFNVRKTPFVDKDNMLYEVSGVNNQSRNVAGHDVVEGGKWEYRDAVTGKTYKGNEWVDFGDGYTIYFPEQWKNKEYCKITDYPTPPKRNSVEKTSNLDFDAINRILGAKEQPRW